MSENESKAFGHMNLDDEGNSIELRQDNLSLYTHIGRYALYDHVYLRVDDTSGYYFWNTAPQYEVLKKAVEDNDCFQVLNMPEATENDQEMYIRHNTVDLDDCYPEEWDEE